MTLIANEKLKSEFFDTFIESARINFPLEKDIDSNSLKSVFENLVLENQPNYYDEFLKGEGLYFSFSFYFANYLFSEGELEKYKNKSQDILDFLISKRDFKNLIRFSEAVEGKLSEDKRQAYRVLALIYQGHYEKVVDQIKVLKESLSTESFEKVLNFLSANINFEEAKRLENIHLIDRYLVKKLDLVLDLFSDYEIEILKKNLLRLFVNKLIFGYEKPDCVVELLAFLWKIKDKNFAKDILEFSKANLLLRGTDNLELIEERINQIEEPLEQKQSRPTYESQKPESFYILENVQDDFEKKLFLEAKVQWRNLEIHKKKSQFEFSFYEQLNNRNWELCHTMIEDMLVLYPEKAFSYLYLNALAYLEEENYIQAQIIAEDWLEKNFDLGIDVNPKPIADMKYLLAEALLNQGKTKRALGEYKQVVAYDANYRLAKERISDIEQDK